MTEQEQLITTRRAEPWREELRKRMKNKERTDIPRVKMPELDPEYRSHTRLEEVNLGLSPEQARREAQRCLDCPKPTCMQGCPVGIHIPTFIKNIERGEFLEAARVLKETSALPAVCGRVCPQEKQCESQCIHLKMGKEAVAIGYLERFAADYERESGHVSIPTVAPANGIKVAVVGSGPAGLSFAGEMAKRGYDVTVFEALHEIGGVLKYGIPEFRLPNRIVDVEIDGVGVMSSNEYLTRVNLMDAANPESDTPVQQGKRVAVIGGGNTAMDSVRTAKRLGAERAMIIYRRSEEEMPARLEEVKHAKEEGVEFLTLHNPIEYIGDERGRVRQMRLQKMQLGEPDASGRRRPIPIEGAIETVEVDEVIVSVGVSPNPLIPRAFSGLEISKKGTIVVDEASRRSALPDVYAGGDIVRGGATVILAMGDGKKAASSMDEAMRAN